MWIVRNSIVPFKGFAALTLWPFIFVRKGAKMSEEALRHEQTHASQQKEMLVLPFLLWYAIEWLVRLSVCSNAHKAYKTVGFEQEAYLNEHDAEYLQKRRHFAWMKYIF